MSSELYRKLNSLFHWTTLWLTSYDQKKQVNVLTESCLVKKPISLHISSNAFDVTKLYQNNPQCKL